jgi:hypothetical protein
MNMNTTTSRYPHPAIIAVMIPVGLACGAIGAGAAGLAALRLLALAYLVISRL